MPVRNVVRKSAGSGEVREWWLEEDEDGTVFLKCGPDDGWYVLEIIENHIDLMGDIGREAGLDLDKRSRVQIKGNPKRRKP